MSDWRNQLTFDPLQPLLSSGNEALVFFARRDLMGEDPGSVDRLWKLPAAVKILARQQPNGSWPRPGAPRHTAVNYPLIETWREFRFLVEQYGFTREHPQARKAAEFLFSCQTEAGDIRGFLANQYATYYTGAVLSLLIQAGYADDRRVEKGLQWLLTMRQSDGGWTIPILTHALDRETQYRLTSRYEKPLEPDRSKPFSHHWTGMVLRAFAAHPAHRKTDPVLKAAELLKARFFLPDSYSSYRAAEYWIRFEYPFWWNNLVTALDSLSLIGLSADDPDIRRGLEWLRVHQESDGSWKRSYAKSRGEEKISAKAQEMKLWISLAIGRVFSRFHG